MEINDLELFVKKNKKSHIIFDFDETLFWLVLPWDRYGEISRKKLSSLDSTIINEYLQGKISMSVMQNLYVRKFGDQALSVIRDITTMFEVDSLQRVVENPDLIEFIRKNSNKFTFYIWSTNTSAVINKILVKHGLDTLFIKIASRLELSFVKPEPDGFYYLQQKGVPKSQYLMVGNSIADRQASLAAGIDFFQISYFTKNPQED